MANVVDERVLRAALSAAAARLTDAELLQRFSEGNEVAFETLVKRHTGMVLGVCRRLLSTIQDAEDACQATFLVLARKAKTGRWQPSIANWLYTTARRVASKVNRAVARRRKREARIVPAAPVSALDQMTGREAFAALDEELGRLAPIYREPLVLYYLQGLTRDEAALRLGIPVATLKSQLDRGRKKLADALTRRGIDIGIGLIAIAATSSASASSPCLVELILATVGGSPSPAVAALALEVTMNGALSKAKWLLFLLVMAALSGFGLTSLPMAAGPDKAAKKTEPPDSKQEAKTMEKQKPEVEQRILRGKVIGADGKPMEADLTFVWDFLGKPLQLGKSKADGSFQVTVPLSKQDSGWLVAMAPGHSMDFHPTYYSSYLSSWTQTTALTLRLTRAQRIRGRVLDSQGKPVAAAAVVARSVSAFGSDAEADAHLLNWATNNFRRRTWPDGEHSIRFRDGRDQIKVDGRSPYRARTNQDGQFEIDGFGAGQLVTLFITAKGLSDQEILILNRAGFDPNPINKMIRENMSPSHWFGKQWRLAGLDGTVILETEKLIRGTVTDDRGKPRAGVQVRFSRLGSQKPNPDENWAMTDKDGHYEIHGARKHKGYMVDVPPDAEAGLLQCEGFAEDTVGYEPITIDLKCARGVVIHGTIKNKVTQEPIQASMEVNVLANNPFVKKFPTFGHGASLIFDQYASDKNGRFKVVVLPGPCVLTAWTGRDADFKPVVPDPNYPDSFRVEHGQLMYQSYAHGQILVDRTWCKVIDAKETDTEVTMNIELEPAKKHSLKVVDSDGKPVTDTKAAGITHIPYASLAFPNTDTITLSNLDPKKARLVAVVHVKRKLVGITTVTAEDKNPKITLSKCATVTGRAVDTKGKPLAGIRLAIGFSHDELHQAFRALTNVDALVTDGNGEFTIDTLIPGETFFMTFYQGRKEYRPFDMQYTIPKHKAILKLGDLKLEASKAE